MHKAHFSIDKETYLKRLEKGVYKSSWDQLWHRDIPNDFDTFHKYLVRVGHEWGWDSMKDRFSAAAMNPKLSHPETKLRELMEQDRVVGYTLILSPAQKLKDRFWNAADHSGVIEIENLGLFPEECGGGKGWSFFEMQFKDLFQRYGTVYWSMSSTNHPHLQAYYERKGMNLLATDNLQLHTPTLAAE